MKKHLLLVLLMFTVVAFSQTKKNYNIGLLLLDSQTEDTKLLLSRLRNEIKAVVGEDAIINFPQASLLINNFNLEQARTNYNTLLNGNTDIILAFGLFTNSPYARII